MGILSWSRVTKSRLPFEVNVMLNLSVTISWVRASLSWNLNGLCYGYLVQFLNNSTFKSVLDRYESKTKLPCKCQIAASCQRNVSQALYQTITNNKIKLLNCLVYRSSLLSSFWDKVDSKHTRGASGEVRLVCIILLFCPQHVALRKEWRELAV